MPETLGLAGFDEVVVIGRGGFGVVYRARQSDFDRLVAVKVLPGAFDERARSRFDRERRALGALSSHPNIVQVHSSGLTEEGYPYLVMEFAPGGSLGERIGRDGPLPWAEGARVGAKLAEALAVAHERGVLHRDVKPENVLFSAYGEPMLADFGIAQIAGQTATRTGIVTATLEHAAPEVLQGARPSQASDQYSLASTMYAAISGRAPFVRDTDESFIPLITRTATEPPPDLRSHGVPDPVASALERGLAKEPEQRYPSVHDFADALQASAAPPGAAPTAGTPAAATSTVTPTPPPPPTPTPTPPAAPPPSPPGSTRGVAPSPAPDRGDGSGRTGRRGLLVGLGVVVLVAIVAALVIVLTSGGGGGGGGGTPTPVAGQLLFNDSLSAATRQLHASSDASSSTEFVNGKARITNKAGSGSIEVLPSFSATSGQLASVRAAVDVYSTNRQEAAGLSCRNQSDSSRYAFLIDAAGDYGVFKNSNGGSNELLSGSVNGADHYRVQIQCTGPEQPGPTDTVNLTLKIDSNTFTTSDSSSALASGGVALEVDGANTADFANLSVAAVR